MLVNEELGLQELDNINNDWGEQKNIIESHQDKAQALYSKLKKWEESLPQQPPADCFSNERRCLK